MAAPDISMTDVFISYASEDRERVDRLTKQAVHIEQLELLSPSTSDAAGSDTAVMVTRIDRLSERVSR